MHELESHKGKKSTLADVIEMVLDKGLVINADIAVSLVGIDLLGIRINAALASFETAARFGLEFPLGTNLQTPAWKMILADGEKGAASPLPCSPEAEPLVATARKG